MSARVVRPVAMLAALMLSAQPAAAATTFFIRGGGNGHGIGMSQYGAYGYAQHGKSYEFILAHYYQGTAVGTVDPNRSVRVLIGTSAAQLSGASRAGATQLQSTSSYSARANADGSLTLLSAAGRELGRFASPLTVSGTGPLSVGGERYRGSLELRSAGGSVEAIDVVDLEDYVRGVISAEMPASWSPEALKAQAVAARTYAITTNVGGRAYDVYSDTRSQMYRGVAAETRATDSAVAATRGQVVTYKGRPVVTYFFSSSGGYTENIENVWPGATPEPWLRGVPDPYDGAGHDPYHRWGFDLSTSSATAKLSGLVNGQLIGIHVTKHGASPRILTAAVVGTKGRTTVSGTQLQRAFGLLTTYASFTTISTYSGGAAAPTQHGIHGSVFPAARGAKVSIQTQVHGGWWTVSTVAAGADGSYAATLSSPGTYRVAYSGLNGPSVSVR